MPSQGEIIEKLAKELERARIISELENIRSMEELQEYINRLKAKNEK